MLKIKRVYEMPDKSDGIRIIVDRLWPRGIEKKKVKIDYWIKDIAPSNGLRKWFGHKEERWQEFKIRYLEELNTNGKVVQRLKDVTKDKTATLLYAAKDTERNNASVLLGFLERR